ncbi:response regulator [Pedococcus bigeumensis]|uniref:Adenylate/guanylate cyclase domain-containing response regulator n=1 Tax=Pedococcus bigeumensis TaxID=433644 RepID=A0A502CWU0_9MICO|nr:response regulator [Pedococcus bigeumensis]TPG17122.1 adenylate/guanylate cyclase domain-containing response regulator [Pedococcus bigeumensis]
MRTDDAVILVVDDLPQNVKLMDAVLSPRGFVVHTATSGEEALTWLSTRVPDLVLLDILMPGIDGYETCRQIRANEATSYLPVVMVTASGQEQKLRAIEAGADDFVTKPFEQAELLARVRSLVRVKRYHDTIERQAAELADWNRELEAKVAAQVTELERVGRLRRFLSPQVAGLVVESGDDTFLESHRSEITAVYCDLRGFTSFAETAEPEEVMSVLREYHEALGDLVFRFEGTLEHFAGDGLLVFFNDPIPCPDAPERAVRMAVAMRGRVAELADGWKRRGHELGFGVGIAQGYATLGRVGFEGRYDYAAIGTVTNLSARLSGMAAAGQILVTQRVVTGASEVAVTRSLGPMELRGITRPVEVFDVLGLDAARTAP